MNKIEQGWMFGDVRDDELRRNPSLNNFEKLPISEKKYVITVAFETLRTLLALGYHVSMETKEKQQSNRMKFVKLGNK